MLLKSRSIAVVLSLLALNACTASTEEPLEDVALASQLSSRSTELPTREYLVVPNRSDSTIAILSNDGSNEILRTITEADVGFRFEPIYASHLERQELVAISDRMTNSVMLFDNASFQYLGRIPASEGLFHMWPSADERELFVVADIDNAVDAIKIARYGDQVYYRRRVFDINNVVPNGKPHDIVADGSHFYVTVQDKDADRDVILKVRQRSLRAVRALEFSIDTHLGMPIHTPFLLVPESVDGQLNLVDRKSFRVLATLDGVTGAHGIFWDTYASRIFLADFGSTGPSSVYEVSRTPGNFEMKIANVIDLPDAKAHNITVDYPAGRMFVTHSGPNNDGNLNTNVAVIDINGSEPQVVDAVNTGSNPLGILLVQR